MLKLSEQTLILYLIFSKYRKDIKSFSQGLGDGGFWSFQLSKIHLLATREEKAIILLSFRVKQVNSLGTPKIEVSRPGLLRALRVYHRRRTRMSPTLDRSKMCV